MKKYCSQSANNLYKIIVQSFNSKGEMEMNDINLSEQIRKLRMSKKFTLAVMAERLGVTTSTVAAYENGTRNPSFEVLVKLARIFNVTVDNLLGYTTQDLIDVSGLSSIQRENIQDMILTYRKFNHLIISTFELEDYTFETDIENYLTNDFDEFQKQVERKKKKPKNVVVEKANEEEVNKAEEYNNKHLKENAGQKAKNLEERIKILEDMIKSNNKSNDT